MATLDYNKGIGELKNWIVSESNFCPQYQGKYESIFCLGNGYQGIRSSTEESYVGQVRNSFVAGTFNKCNENEVTELPNAADVMGTDFIIDDDLFSLEKGSYSNYKRSLNLRTGELEREFVWDNGKGKHFKFNFKRFVSFHDLHTVASKVTITAIDKEVAIKITSGINGQVTNSGAQHFIEGDKRIFDHQFLQMIQTTSESKIDFIHNTVHRLQTDGQEEKSAFEMDRRKLQISYEVKLTKNQAITFSKISNIYTSHDQEAELLESDEYRGFTISKLKDQSGKGYDRLYEESAEEWAKYWSAMDIVIESENSYDQLAIRFAQFHLLAMTPKHDARSGIAAKGLSGEGYKGHSFWDTEIFILPFFTYTFPEIAKSLLEYRYITLADALEKAIDNGYRGAMYPWESAGRGDGEVTPVWGAADIITGKATKIWSGFIEQHITSDIAFAIWQYFMITGDDDFMKSSGYEMLFDIAIFWGSRLEWNEAEQAYHINDVVGPDEYKEHINNDAFTNYMAYWCMENAINYYDILRNNDKETFDRLNDLLDLEKEIKELATKLAQVYLPQPNEALVIPQDDTYLGKKLIDLSKYKNQTLVGSIFQDFNLDQINEIQVSKQAAVVMLLYLLEHKFSPEIKEATYDYYEAKTLHDSSLSLTTFAVLAADMDHLELAYELFQKAAEIDLGPNMKSSDHGIHAASFGGIWQIIICGFAGVRMAGGKLRINPKLPPQFTSITFPILWQGNNLTVKVDRSSIYVKNKGVNAVSLFVYGNEYAVVDELRVNY